jgi:LysM repeat protein
MANETEEIRRDVPERAEASDRPRRRGIRAVLGVPLAIVSTVAVTLGIAQPAEAATPQVKRHAKAKAQGSTVHRTAAVAAVAPAPAEYVVAEGDTVSGIAERFGLATAEVLAANGLGWSSLIFAGQRLALPAGAPAADAAPAPLPVAPEIARHVVVEGDTIGGIAATYGLDVASVLSANGLGPSSLIFPGESIVLPLTDPSVVSPAPIPRPEPAATSPEPAPVPAPVVAHVVVDGDTLVAIASVTMPLDDETRANARIVVDVGRALGVPDQGIVIALAAAAQESGLRNIHHGDLDSLGLFQQRPSQGWGAREDVLDPVRATTAFYVGHAEPSAGGTLGLLDIAGWESMSVTQAAQAVQRSAHPDHYAKWEAQARAWLSELG